MVASVSRSHKVVKKTKEKNVSNTIELVEVEQATGEDDLSPDSRQRGKRSQGIVIDGRTYTCATCKAGHRVGICKHAKDRPMKPTHPPGRPPAGAPKKVVCDCPKDCSCAKKDCKCARTCNCTQMMYMLVYVSAPEEEVEIDPDDEKGQWKLGEQVVTDLKGNILTPEQVKERKDKKLAMKMLSTNDQPRNASLPIKRTNAESRSTSSERTLSEPVKSCCKHKETVATRKTIPQTLPTPDPPIKSVADGCNCGHTCTCAFCPQHPNNATSINVARKQAVYFANHAVMNDQSIVPFLPDIPQGASCMGGQPRFAISRNAIRPSFDDLQRTFPNPGYVIGYPIWSTRMDSAGLPIAPFPITNPSYLNMGMPVSHSSLLSGPSMFQSHQMVSMNQGVNIDFSQDEFDIGSAFVASAGVDGWGTSSLSSDFWQTNNPTLSTPFADMQDQNLFMDTTGFQLGSISHEQTTDDPNSTMQPDMKTQNFSKLGIEPFRDKFPLAGQSSYHRKSCCEVPTGSNAIIDINEFSGEHPSAHMGSPTGIYSPG